MRSALRNRLAFRFGFGLCLGVGTILIATGAWTLRLERTHLLRLVELTASERAEVIRGSTREAMLRNDPGELRRIIDAIAGQDTIERIRVFDKRGRISSSSDLSEVGSFVDTTAEQCVSCHRQNQTLERLEREDRARIFAKPDGGRVLGVIAPIRNEASCAEADCHAHSTSQTVLGVLDVQLSLSEVDLALQSSGQRMIIGLSVTALAMLALIWVLTWRLVLRPVERLTEGAARVAAGDLTTRMPLTSNDEIGDMTRAWNAMIAELEDAQSELERWGTTLEQKVELKTRELEKAHRHLLHVEKMAAMGKMASVVAHEINNPLTGIATYARLLQRKLAQASHRNADSEGPEPGELERVLGLIEGEASRCGAIARDLLLFSRTPAARFAPQDIPPLIERCLMLLEHQAAGRAIHLESRVGNKLPLISCDGSQIQQMLLALTLNAIEATPPDGRVTISADLDDGGDQMVLRVTDTGCGIPSADLDKIFEPFFTTKADAEGVGLGLAVVYGVVKRHHGSVVVDSSPARGTEFTIRIPICQRDVPKSTSLTFGETADES